MYQAGHNALRMGMNTRELPGGVTVHTFSPSPDDFDPLKADEKELLAYGYPSRPQDPALAERWEQMLSRPVRMIEPTFDSLPHKTHRLVQVDTGAVVDAVVDDSLSGAVVQAPDGDMFTRIEGRWTVPNVSLPPADAPADAWFAASTWIGIDGLDGSGDMLRAGCDSDVTNSDGDALRRVSPWWEWFPAPPFSISNLPVTQGDTVDCVIWTDPGSTTAANIFMQTVADGVGMSFRATAPYGTSLAGNSAEWIVGRDAVDAGSSYELARYGDVYFAEARAWTKAEKVIHADSGTIIIMTDTGAGSGRRLSTGMIEAPTLVQVRYAGP